MDASDWRVDVCQRTPKAATAVWPVEIYMDYGGCLRTRLRCAVLLGGGENGGHVSISIVGDSNLIQYGGHPLPIERDLEPYEVFAFANTYKAVSESSGYEAIVVTATFDENDTDWSEKSIAKATAVRVEIKLQVLAPENESENRHRFGIGETVECRNFPNIPQLEWVRIGSGAACQTRMPLT